MPIRADQALVAECRTEETLRAEVDDLRGEVEAMRNFHPFISSSERGYPASQSWSFVISFSLVESGTSGLD
jgi:hypothetical protein